MEGDQSGLINVTSVLNKESLRHEVGIFFSTMDNKETFIALVPKAAYKLGAALARESAICEELDKEIPQS